MNNLVVRLILVLSVTTGSGLFSFSSQGAMRGQTPLPCASPSTPTPCATQAAETACSITAVQSGQLTNFELTNVPKNLPWVEAESVTPRGMKIVGFLFYGDRPLPVGGTFADGSAAKVLWVVNEDVRDFTLSAAMKKGPASRPVFIEVNPATGTHRQYPSTIAFPEHGCWNVTIAASTDDGVPVSGKVVFEVSN